MIFTPEQQIGFEFMCLSIGSTKNSDETKHFQEVIQELSPVMDKLHSAVVPDGFSHKGANDLSDPSILDPYQLVRLAGVRQAYMDTRYAFKKPSEMVARIERIHESAWALACTDVNGRTLKYRKGFTQDEFTEVWPFTDGISIDYDEQMPGSVVKTALMKANDYSAIVVAHLTGTHKPIEEFKKKRPPSKIVKEYAWDVYKLGIRHAQVAAVDISHVPNFKNLILFLNGAFHPDHYVKGSHIREVEIGRLASSRGIVVVGKPVTDSANPVQVVLDHAQLIGMQKLAA